MAYDPQANRKRPQPAAEEAAPVEALLPDIPAAQAASATTEAQPATAGGTGPGLGATGDDPPPEPAVTPGPANPPSDKMLVNTGLSAAFGGLALLLAVRYFWRRRTRSRSAQAATSAAN